MIRVRVAWIIFRKELLETFRDRRTLLMMVGLPVLIYPLIFLGMTKLQEAQIEAREARASRVAVWGESESLVGFLRKTNTVTVMPWAGAPAGLEERFRSGSVSMPVVAEAGGKGRRARGESEPENPVLTAARAAVNGRKADAVVVLWPGFEREIANGDQGRLSIYFDSVREDSRKAHDRVEEVVAGYRVKVLRAREEALRLAKGFSTVVEVRSRNIAAAHRRTGQILGSVLPILLIIVSASSGLYAAIDLTAGEKERNTMQTLLCAPVHYGEIIVGKFLAVFTITAIAALANIASLAATFARIFQSAGDFSIAPSTFVFTFFMLIPVIFTISAIFVAVAVFAKDFKDGQNFLTPVLMGLTLPLSATILPGVELNPWTAFVPIVNIALLIKATFLGEAHVDVVFLTLMSSVVYGVVTLLFAARIFEREHVLLGGRESMRGLLRWERKAGAEPGPALALVAFAIVFVIAFYGSLSLQGTGVLTMLLVTQYGFFLLPNLAIARFFRFAPARLYSLRLPDLRSAAGCVLIGLSAWAVSAGILIRLMPPPESWAEAMEKVLLLDGKPIPLWLGLLVIALTPAVCEELFFRGLVMSGFRRLGKWPAIVLSAFLFAVAHSSIYRLMPTLFLGILLGYAVWRSGSIVCGMIIHAVNNGLLVGFLHAEPLLKQWGVAEVKFLPWSITLAGVAVLVAGWFLLRSGIDRGGERRRGDVGKG